MPTRTVVFDGQNARQEASKFAQDLVGALNDPGPSRSKSLQAFGPNNGKTGTFHGHTDAFGPSRALSHVGLERAAGMFGGSVRFAGHVGSTDARELDMYDYKQFVHPQDRLYLSSRDQTGMFLVHKIPNDLWSKPPKLPRTQRDKREVSDFLVRLKRLGYFEAAKAAHKLARRDGGAFVLVQTTGDPSTPLTSDEQLRGFRKVPLSAVDPNSIQRADTRGGVGLNFNPFVRVHGVEELNLITVGEGRQRKRFPVHGSRLQLFIEEDSPEPGELRADSILDINHDGLWNWRDIIVSQRNAQIQGNPVAVDVNVEEGFSTRTRPSVQGTDEDPNVVLQEEMEEWQYFGDQHFSAIEGVELRRIGSAELEVPTDIIASITERIAQSEDLPVGMVFPTALDSREVQQEKEAYFDVVKRWNEDFVWHRLDEMFRLGQTLNAVRRRLTFPLHELEWRDPQYYNAREWSFVQGKQAQVARDATLAGYDIPEPLRDTWEERSEPPEASQVNLRNEGGGEAGNAGRQPGDRDGQGQAAAGMTRHEVETLIERIIEEKDQEDELR